MQALIPVFAILGVATSAQLTLLPYAYLADPLPVYHQSQDTRAGVHAYSYAGGPSAKEEVRGLDGVTRGSYSYVDANGILQSIFYVADEGGFRVAATNLPTDGEQLIGNAQLHQEHVKVEEARSTTSRRKRSLEASPTVDQDQTKNLKSSQGDSANASPKSSHESPAQEKKTDTVWSNSGTIVAPVYGLSDSILIPRLTGAATSSQSRVDIHNNAHLKAVQPVETIGVLPAPAIHEARILPGYVPLATSHQSRVQVHNNLRVEAPEKLVKDAVILPETSPVVPVQLGPFPVLPALPDYYENRIHLHKNLGIEGPNPKDAVKLDAVPLAIVETPIKTPVPVVAKQAVIPVVTKQAVLPVVAKQAVLPIVAQQAIVPVVAKQAVLPVVAKQTALPVVTAVSSQSRTQIHRNSKLEVAVPIVSEPSVYTVPYAQPIPAAWAILATPLAHSSQFRSQVHLNEKLQPAK